MDFELRQAKEKWERENTEKKERARRDRDRERKAKEEAAKRQQAIESAHLARRLEEAAASLAAQQREEEDLRLGDGIVFDKVLRAVAVPGTGDKIRLPASAFEELSSQNAIDKGPMFFEISVASARPPNDPSGEEEEEPKATHSGVLEFVAREGFVELPPHVWLNSGLAEASLQGQTNARVRYVRLSKGTYAKFKAEGLDFVDVPNHKAVLETKLRQHASLSVGDLLKVQHAGVEYGLRVMELKPTPSVSVLETDMEADVVGGIVDNTEQVGASAQSRLVPLELGKTQKGAVSQGQYMYYKFRLDTALSKSVAGGELDVLVHLNVVDSAEAADADIYVGAHPLLFPTQHNHEWSSHNKGSKVIVLSSSGRKLSASTYSVGVHGFTGDTKFEILVDAKPATIQQQPSAGQRVGSGVVESTSNLPREGFEPCGNCKQQVAVGKKLLHEAYCYRHNVLCKEPNCGVVLRKEEMANHVHCSRCGHVLKREEVDKHMKIFHEPLRCGCGEVLEMEEMVAHRTNACPLRSITCRFCGDMVQAGAQADNVRDRLNGLTEHESSCGSRTAPCDSCGRVIMLKEMDLHKAATHTVSLNTPHPSSVESTPRQMDGATDLAARGIQCPICDKQFGGGDATWRLNEHIDSEHWAADTKRDATATAMEVDNRVVEPHTHNVPSAFGSRARSLSVSCPICGVSVHSERDLSSHIDLVH